MPLLFVVIMGGLVNCMQLSIISST